MAGSYGSAIFLIYMKVPSKALTLLESLSLFVVAVGLRIRSLRLAPFTWSSHAGYLDKNNSKRSDMFSA